MVRSIPSILARDAHHFETCEICKPARKPRPKSSREARLSRKPLDLVHIELVGPISPTSLNESRYFIPMYDYDSSLSLVRFITKKSDAASAIREMVNELERVQNSKIHRLVVKRIRSNNAKEFLSTNLKHWLSEKGIIHESTPAYSPEPNGRAERINRALLDMARAMLLNAQLVPGWMQLWAEAVNTANYIRNRV